MPVRKEQNPHFFIGNPLNENLKIPKVCQSANRKSAKGTADETPLLKVVGNEKEEGSGKWQMIDIGLGLW